MVTVHKPTTVITITVVSRWQPGIWFRETIAIITYVGSSHNPKIDTFICRWNNVCNKRLVMAYFDPVSSFSYLFYFGKTTVIECTG